MDSSDVHEKAYLRIGKDNAKLECKENSIDFYRLWEPNRYKEMKLCKNLHILRNKFLFILRILHKFNILVLLDHLWAL